MDEPTLSRQPPYSEDAEQAVLGGILLNPDRLADAQELLEPEDFYRRSNQLIFAAMNSLNDREINIDVVSVKEELERDNHLDDVGGVAYMAELADAVPTSTNVGYYAKIVNDKATMRRVIQAAQTIAAKGYDGADEPIDLLSEAEETFSRISQGGRDTGFRAIRDVLQNAMDEIDKMATNDDQVTGLATGYHDLDQLTTGFHDDELIIIAARPGMGKTAFALNIAQNVGRDTNKAVAIFSLEMGAESLVNRMLCSEGSIDATHLRTGNLNQDEWERLLVAMGSLSKMNIYFDDTAGVKVGEIRAKCRRLAKDPDVDLGLVIIDYLQLIEGSGRENRQQEVSEISRQLKKLAKELSIPVIAMSQLSRGVEQRQDKRPVLSDIRESGSIEQDADIVAFIYRDDYYRDEDGDDDDGGGDQQESDDQDVGEVEIILEKNRSGARGTVNLLFAKSLNKFVNISNRTE
ncbi:dnaC protein [Lacticaseibacillus pantheris DSM 15945 = JCM 12539 = NBRC 106106]|uniref:Replicative DNA helicase n=1 Tax=Lacticaseibacillus pantheris DSM 15945 = JCM 12539 = NBRC 106106 TaxID=1423783 RepID=A0A0R1U2J4_9LACO|nr:replicative DNA helicase [Lacticaseibacillus pantheris]KRL87542.1 dnaC protein [Lacticaseibacillus pantheris DSM 15945 = JCM 12539 = NBRC 106106]